ncbi:MAG TPA: R3H domain-containing nucleic acid-binding protein [Vicinamibacterales bacterium]|jgi:spoIIIJ-associated protein
MSSVQERAGSLVRGVLAAMDLPSLNVTIVDAPDAVRVEIDGAGGEVLLKRKGEALDALQQIVNTGFRRELTDDRSFVVDCMGYRKGKDEELRQMTRFTMERVRASGPQEMGPLNPYARRIVHLTVAEDPAMSSESVGDAFLKTVIISKK